MAIFLELMNIPFVYLQSLGKLPKLVAEETLEQPMRHQVEHHPTVTFNEGGYIQCYILPHLLYWWTIK